MNLFSREFKVSWLGVQPVCQSWPRPATDYLNLKEEPLVNSTGFGLGLGSSNSRKNAWYSTQIFQKILQQSRLAIMNSSVSWQLLC